MFSMSFTYLRIKLVGGALAKMIGKASQEQSRMQPTKHVEGEPKRWWAKCEKASLVVIALTGSQMH